jgi:hypothetical protein
VSVTAGDTIAEQMIAVFLNDRKCRNPPYGGFRMGLNE